MGRSWVIPFFDSRIVIDRDNSEIVLRDRVFGFSSESRVWIEVRDMGKIHLDTRYGLRSDVGEIASLGSRIADFMRKPFIDTSRW